MSKKKKVIIILIIIFIIGFLSVRELKKRDCLKECRYSRNSRVWILKIEESNRYFPNQEQCIDYCLKFK